MAARKAPAKKATAKKATAKKPARKRTPAKKATASHNGRVTPKKTAKPGRNGKPFDPRAALAASEQYKGFEFLSWDGESTHTLPNPLTLDPVDVRRAVGLPPEADFEIEDFDEFSTEQIFGVLDALVPDAWHAIQEMPLAARAQTLEAWTEWLIDEVGDPGKGRSKSSAPNRAGRRSRQT